MQIFKVDPKRPQPDVVDKAARILQLGGIVVYPTETLYGLGANIMDTESTQKVFDIKGRKEDKPISIVFRDLGQAEKYAVFNENSRRLAELFMPGPITLILPAKINLGEIFGGDRIAVRISSNRVVQAILEKTRFPITATSANLSGKTDPVSAKDSIEQIGEKVDVVLDSGECEYGRPSTVVDVTGGRVEVVREGVIPRKRIVSFLKAGANRQK
ncbi:MAG: threonylcarbamoyl-AMP synthase [Candidatus Aenigmarchaeota archaeon]|nr:threonylcarbamoyl-AMP synthase [Candidatus Aenigmarchaeota archaeon]